MTDNAVQTPLVMDDFWGAVEEAAKSGRSGGGYVGKVEIGFCWKVFISPEVVPDQDSTIFPYEVNPDKKVTVANSAAARALASKFIVDHGIDKDPYNVFYIRLFKDTIIGREVQWKGDRIGYSFPNSPAFQSVILPKLHEAFAKVGFSRFGEMWARVSWMDDPDQKRARMLPKKDKEGNVILDDNGEPEMEKETILTMYVSEVFLDKNAAMSAVDGVEDVLGDEKPLAMPEGYDAEAWQMTIDEIRTEFQKGTIAPKLAKSYDLPIATVNAIVADLVKK